MRNNYSSYSFSQTFIASLTNLSVPTVNRLIRSLKVGELNDDKHKIKKYSYESTRLINRRLLQNLKISRKIHTFYNLKGGTGKTSISAQIGSNLAILGFKVIIIDCDPQAHMTTYLGFKDTEDHYTLYDIIINNINIKNAVQPVIPGIDAILSNLSLSRIEVPLAQKARREEKLLETINTLTDSYDFIIIDTNPSFSNLNLNALYCADQINFVCETAPFSLYGLKLMLSETSNFFKDMKKDFVFKIIPNKYESKTATAQEVLGYLRANYKDSVIDSIVRKCEDINIASKNCRPVSTFCKKRSLAFEDLNDLTHEIIKLSKN